MLQLLRSIDCSTSETRAEICISKCMLLFARNCFVSCTTCHVSLMCPVKLKNSVVEIDGNKQFRNGVVFSCHATM
jgi:hypothetical protein